jgi:hypothetical protein
MVTEAAEGETVVILELVMMEMPVQSLAMVDS